MCQFFHRNDQHNKYPRCICSDMLAGYGEMPIPDMRIAGALSFNPYEPIASKTRRHRPWTGLLMRRMRNGGYVRQQIRGPYVKIDVSRPTLTFPTPQPASGSLKSRRGGVHMRDGHKMLERWQGGDTLVLSSLAQVNCHNPLGGPFTTMMRRIAAKVLRGAMGLQVRKDVSGGMGAC